jgi:hypothetical protein
MATNLEKQHCAEREVKFRLRVYPRRVSEGRLSEAKAREEIALMEEIAADYRMAAERERMI